MFFVFSNPGIRFEHSFKSKLSVNAVLRFCYLADQFKTCVRNQQNGKKDKNRIIPGWIKNELLLSSDNF